MKILVMPTIHRAWTPFFPLTVMATLNKFKGVEFWIDCSKNYVNDITEYYHDKRIHWYKGEKEPIHFDFALLSGFGYSYWWGTPYHLKKNNVADMIVYWDAEPQWTTGKYKDIDLVFSHMGNKDLYSMELPQLFNKYKHERKVDEETYFMPHPINLEEFCKDRTTDLFSFSPKVEKTDYLITHHSEVGRNIERKEKGEKIVEFGRDEELIKRVLGLPLKGKKIIYGQWWDKDTEAMSILSKNGWKHILEYPWQDTYRIFKDTGCVFQFCRKTKGEIVRCLYSERTTQAMATNSVLISDKITKNDEDLGLVDGETYVLMDSTLSDLELQRKIEVSYDYGKYISNKARERILPAFDANVWAKILYQTIEEKMKK